MTKRPPLKNKYTKGSIVIRLLIFACTIGLILFFLSFSNKKCHEPVRFSIGNIDPKFKIDSNEVATVAKEAASRWNGQENEDLLEYDPAAKLKIDLIYDDRQKELDKISSMTSSSDVERDQISVSDEQLKSMVSLYEADLKMYNERVAYYNSIGGAPEDVYSSYNEEKKKLDARADQIQKMARELNIKVGNFNSNISVLNQEIDGQKNKVITQGLYKPADNKIEIYTFSSDNELRLVLMHELGHAFGLDHLQNEKSIMYYLLQNQDLSNPTVTAEDTAAVSGRCNIKNLYFYSWLLKFAPNKQ